MYLIFSCIILLLTSELYATSFEFEGWKYSFEGYLKHESIGDSRQNLGAADNQALLFPQAALLDARGKDITRRGQYDMFTLESRLVLSVHGPQCGPIKPTAVIAGDFFGRNLLLDIFTLRYAYMILDTTPVSLLIGYYWHPLCFEQYCSNVISNNNGDPFECDSRNPQFRITYTRNRTQFIFAALAQLDFVNDGPIGLDSSYLRNAMVPNVDAQVRHTFGEHAVGIALDFKRLAPRLVTNNDVKAREFILSGACSAFLALKWPVLSCISTVAYGQNLTNLVLLGGYAVHSINPITDHRTYANLTVLSYWTDIEILKWEKLCKPGIFIGYAQNRGSRHTIIPDLVDNTGTVIERRVFGIGTAINNIERISPRIRLIYKALTAGIELECTRAAYGSLNNKGVPINTKPVTNVRLLLALYYIF